MPPARMYLFDDSPHDRDARLVNLRRAQNTVVTEALGRGEAVEAAPIQATSSRSELFEWLDANEDPAVVVADLLSEHDDLGWVGARILISIAEDRALAERYWRVALSQWATPEIAAELEGAAHALVRDDPLNVEDYLVSALDEIVALPPVQRRAIVRFPVTDHPKDWDETVGRVVEELVGADFKRQDEHIVRQLWLGVTHEVIDAQLRIERRIRGDDPEDRKDVNKFLKAVQNHLGEPNTQEAKRRIMRAEVNLRGKTMHQALQPALVERADLLIKEYLSLDPALRSVHRLTDAQYRLALELVNVYAQNLGAPHGNGKNDRHIALRMALEDPRFAGEGEELQYVFWTLSDVRLTNSL